MNDLTPGWALTICQPYAEIIMLGRKPIENRSWPTNYKGPLYIHAGKSRSWLDEDDERDYPNMAFGAIVGRVEIYDCLEVDRLPPELAGHEHAHGPFCFLLRNVERFETPIPAAGKQGFWRWRP